MIWDTVPEIEYRITRAATQDRAELTRVLAAMDRLPQNLREVLVLRTIEEMSEAETAQMLGIGGKAVETRLYRARRRLGEMLASPR